MHALGNLIRQCRMLDPTLTLERIAQRTEGELSYGTIAKWSSNYEKIDQIPRPSSILALARALNIPPVQVLLASAQAAGIDISDLAMGSNDFSERLPANVDKLSREWQDQLINLIWLAVRDESGASGPPNK